MSDEQDWVKRLGAQYGARQAASLRGDHLGVSVANRWIGIIAQESVYEILQAARGAPPAVGGEPVAWRHWESKWNEWEYSRYPVEGRTCEPLYAAPRESPPIDGEMKEKIIKEWIAAMLTGDRRAAPPAAERPHRDDDWLTAGERWSVSDFSTEALETIRKADATIAALRAALEDERHKAYSRGYQMAAGRAPWPEAQPPSATVKDVEPQRFIMGGMPDEDYKP